MKENPKLSFALLQLGMGKKYESKIPNSNGSGRNCNHGISMNQTQSIAELVSEKLENCI